MCIFKILLLEYAYLSYIIAVFIGLSSALLQPNSRGWCKSFAASVPSGPFKPQRGKRLTKQERRTLAKSFIDKYRASNAGRFPTITYVQREIGGSYYTQKWIVQEIEYHNKLSSLNKGTVQLRKAEDINQSSDAKEVSSTSVRDETLKSVIDSKVRNNISLKDEPSVSLKLGIETKTSMSPSGESVGSRKERSTKDSSHDAPSPKVVKDTGNHGVSVTEEHHSDHHRSSEQGSSSTRMTNLWGNLRSLADGIISLWRKM
ncbi:NUDIX domain [Musa troglodytarum]|uniref:NUDIX domain n=1 Tax=Musa troglodytarum TaxID=320322 RepID=A0A9E7G0B1_9LILI|nr:NUDIX domain [Musa troglodytarum]